MKRTSWAKIREVFLYKDLRKKILYTLWILFVFRLGTHIPVPGVNVDALKTFFSKNTIFGFLDIFSGGAMSQFSILMLGVGPYISASIIMQLLSVIVPSLENLSKEGEEGQRIINRYARYLTVPLAALEALGMIALLSNESLGIIAFENWKQKALTVLVLTAGSIIVMWLGELLSEKGISNGISLILTFGILSRVPLTLKSILVWADSFEKKLMILIFGILGLAIIGFVVYFEQAVRKIPITYARRIRGIKSYGGANTYLPLKINQSGVLPIIFAMSFMMFPGVLGRFLSEVKNQTISRFGYSLSQFFQPDNPFYALLYFILVILFTYFYSSIIFDPEKIADNLQKQGGFIPGIRPGKATANYLRYLVNRLNLTGGIFLGFIALSPFLVEQFYSGVQISLGGTALLIVVSVVIDTVKKIESELIIKSYENY